MEETVRYIQVEGGTPLNEVIGDSRLFLPMRPEVQDMISIAIFGEPEQRVHAQLQLMSSCWPKQQDFGHLVLDLLMG